MHANENHKSNNIYDVLSKKYNINKRIIEVICNHPFVFASRKIQDPNDEKTMMFSYLFKLKVKKRYKCKKLEEYERIEERRALKELSKKHIQVFSVPIDMPK
jgi:hypothetical protein